MTVAVSVAICTWNRAGLLDQTLARMRDLRVPAGLGWELLVVNNNCTDGTDAVIARHEPHLPLRRLFEPAPGHSNARNCAVRHARGELVLWTDDDVLVDEHWLAEMARAAAEHPGAAYFGGTIDPWFAEPPPRWVARNLAALQGPFAIRQLGPDTRPLRDNETVYGANMAFRTTALRAHPFDPKLGRVGSSGMLSGDETGVIERIKVGGGRGVWVGPAKVRHYIPAERMTVGYVWKFFHGLGRTRQRMTPFDRGVPLLFGRPRWLVRRYLAARAKAILFAPTRGRRWVENLTAAAALKGILDECRDARAAGTPADPPAAVPTRG
jgi:glycosyltransferase involved in cell wall biosynthesis